MSDTVKLIIEIPKETKQAFDKAESNDLKGGYYDHGGIIGQAIQNGLQLKRDSELAEMQAYFAGMDYGWEQGRKALVDDVKAEIINKHVSLKEDNNFDIGRTYSYEECLTIIDKHISEERGTS